MSKSATTSKADTAVKLVLIFFISLLSFSVGTYVGKQVSDSEARRAALEIDAGQHHSETAHNEDAATAPMSDTEVASLTEEFLQKERKVASEEVLTVEEKSRIDSELEEQHTAHTEDGYTHRSKLKAEAHESVVASHGAEHGNTHAAAPAAGKAEKKQEHLDATKSAKAEHGVVRKPESHETHAPSNAAERVAKDLAPAPDLRKARNPSSVLPSVASTAVGKYTVQVASYATETEAKEQAAKLTGKGYSAFYVPAQVNNKTWYRVSVGLFSDQKSASNYRTELLATQAVSSAIVQKIVK